MEIAKIKANLTCLKNMPDELQDQESIGRLERKLSHYAGKASTPVGEQRDAAKLTHLLGKVRARYAQDMEACQKEVKAAHAALVAAQARVTKAAESEKSCDLVFSRRQARIQSVLDQCSDALPPTSGAPTAPTIHLPDAPIQHTLLVGVLSSKLAAEKDKMLAEYALDGEALESKTIDAFCARLLEAELSSQASVSINYNNTSTSPMDLLGDDVGGAPSNHTSMDGNLADAWGTPIPMEGETADLDW